MANIDYIGNGKVYLIAGGGKTYTDVAARFCKSERDVEDIIGSPQDLNILKNIVDSNHKAVMEFDDFIFGIEGYSRVTETQLVRKRHASYMIKSGRIELNGKRSFDVTIPPSISDAHVSIELNTNNLFFMVKSRHNKADTISYMRYQEVIDKIPDYVTFVPYLMLNTNTMMEYIERLYNNGIESGIKEEDMRYIKPQATQFKACIKMNAAGLRDWFQIRMCNCAQEEIRDLAKKMYQLCVEACPELFKSAGPSCKVLGYCPEGKRQCSQMKGKIPTKEEALEYLKTWKSE